jgi:hypothetical protein
MVLWGLFSNNFQDDSKRPLVEKWLDTLEPPDLLELSESELENESDIEGETESESDIEGKAEAEVDLNQRPLRAPVTRLLPPVMRHYDLSHVHFAQWQDPYQIQARQPSPPHPDPYSHGYNSNPQSLHKFEYAVIRNPYQTQDEYVSSSEEEEEEDEEDGTFTFVVSLCRLTFKVL